jgi:class 3 adenylate cyclase
MTTRQDIEQAIAALEARRETLGDSVVETSLAALRHQLTDMSRQEVSNSALRGERKQVTVMFADISGFTAMSEKLDPEEVRSMINACFEGLGAEIDRYDGHIDKFIGDEIMALFGAPVAHENDPERALRAALDMRATLKEFNRKYTAQLPQPLALHFGINSGLAIAGGIGTSQRQDYSVMGDTVNLAARLEGLSEAGEILVGESTYRLTASLFEFEALKPVRVKGKEQPVRVYRLLKAKAVLGGQVRGIEGLSAPMVGRVEEFTTLKQALSEFYKGRGGIISVTGDAGLGKSRLIEELHLACIKQSQDDQVAWVEGRALSYAQSASYRVARDMLCNMLGIELEASPVEAALILRTEVEQLLPRQAVDIYPYLAYLLEAHLDEESARRIRYLEGEALHRQILQSVQNFILAKTRQTPLILVWEDLHWADPSSLRLLEALLSLTKNSSLLLFLVYRPVRDSQIWTLHQKASEILNDVHIGIELAPLSDDESSQLLSNLLDHYDLPDKFRHLIVSKAEGNPFYLEEVVRSLIDSGAIKRSDGDQGWVVTAGIDEIKIPDTLQGVIMARIDPLDPETKRTLQVASVIGRDFPYQVLVRVMDKIAGE